MRASSCLAAREQRAASRVRLNLANQQHIEELPVDRERNRAISNIDDVVPVWPPASRTVCSSVTKRVLILSSRSWFSRPSKSASEADAIGIRSERGGLQSRIAQGLLRFSGRWVNLRFARSPRAPARQLGPGLPDAPSENAPESRTNQLPDGHYVRDADCGRASS